MFTMVGRHLQKDTAPALLFVCAAVLLGVAAGCGDGDEDSGTAAVAHRTIDEHGNNISHPQWGAAGARLRRMAPVAYADGVSTPAGPDRPSARAISNAILAQSESIPSRAGLSGFAFQWGQFVDHDLNLTALAAPPEEFDIPVPANDPTFDPTNLGTAILPFLRSKYDPATGTAPGNPRQQVNEITSFLDASMVYGSSDDRARALRTLSGGKLRTSDGNLLPLNAFGLPNADNDTSHPEQYYVAGDLRANEQPGLTAMHTLFMREHNRWCDELAQAHPSWDDETLYQEARRHVSALVQIITFKEFLPTLLGPFSPSVEGAYQPEVDPTIANEFSAAFYRVGHTMLPPELPRVENDGTPAEEGPQPLAEAFFLPSNLRGPGELELRLKGLATLTQQEIDSKVVDGVRNFLVGDPIAGVVLDLASLNIQRARDHGVPSYNQARVALGLAPRSSLAEISSDPQVEEAFAGVYVSIDNVDPWVGGISEDHAPGAQVGELIATVLADQFTRLRDGDRFWYRRDPAFSATEVADLEATRLSDVIRRNTTITNIQDNVFIASR
jgi:peroxidase